MLRLSVIWAVALALWASSGNAAERRQLDSHVHGKGALNIAVEGKLVEMELEVPGMDIVGFEHPAHSAEDRSAIEVAKATLRDGASLFVLPETAGCSLERSEARLVTEDDNGGRGHATHHGHKHGDKHAHEGSDAEKDSHTEFFARYRFGCANPDKITDIAFPYFAKFPNAEGLGIQMVTRRGANAYAVQRDDPKVEIVQ